MEHTKADDWKKFSWILNIINPCLSSALGHHKDVLKTVSYITNNKVYFVFT